MELITIKKEKGRNLIICKCGVKTYEILTMAFHFCILEDKKEDYPK